MLLLTTAAPSSSVNDMHRGVLVGGTLILLGVVLLLYRNWTTKTDTSNSWDESKAQSRTQSRPQFESRRNLAVLPPTEVADTQPRNSRNADLNFEEVVALVQRPYKSPEEKRLSIVASFVNSGAAESGFAEGGGEMLSKLRQQPGLVGDWGCYRLGCFALLLKETSELTHSVVSARDSSIPGHIFVLTAEQPPDKLLILLNHKQE